MVRSRKLFVILAVCLWVIAPARLRAQEFSAAQKEVWKNVETYWDLEMKQDLDGFMSYFHENYRGWSNDGPLPIDKATIRKFTSHDMATSKILVQNLQPVAIQLYGNVAFADYYYSRVVKNAEGKEKTESGRWTDILMKQGDKWVLIGDHGGRTSKPE